MIHQIISSSLRIIVAAVLGLHISTDALRAADVKALVTSGEATIGFIFADAPVPVWTGGRVVAIEKLSSAAPTIFEFDQDGRHLARRTLQVPGTRLINLYFAVRGRDGALAGSGTAHSDDSRAAAFIWWSSPDDREQRLIRTSPFVARELTIARDGTVWTAGWEMSNDAVGTMAEDYDCVRRYDPRGNLLGSFVRRSSLNPHGRIPGGYAYMVSSADRVGWYATAAREYIEFSLDGKLESRYPALSPNMRLHGVALCDDGGLFASAVTQGEKGPNEWHIFILDRENKIWRPIAAPWATDASGNPVKSRYFSLYGCEGTTLIGSYRLPALTRLQPAATQR